MPPAVLSQDEAGDDADASSPQHSSWSPSRAASGGSLPPLGGGGSSGALPRLNSRGSRGGLSSPQASPRQSPRRSPRQSPRQQQFGNQEQDRRTSPRREEPQRASLADFDDDEDVGEISDDVGDDVVFSDDDLDLDNDDDLYDDAF